MFRYQDINTGDGINNPDYKAINVESPPDNNNNRKWIYSFNNSRGMVVQGQLDCRTLNQFGGSSSSGPESSNNLIDTITDGISYDNNLIRGSVF